MNTIFATLRHIGAVHFLFLFFSIILSLNSDASRFNYSQAAIDELDDLVFNQPGDEEKKTGIRSNGFILYHDGQIVFEKYDRGFSKDTRHATWSIGKNITHTFVGIAIHEGLLKLDDSVCDFFKDLEPEKCAITIRHLLQFSSGIKWRETYGNKNPFISTFLAMAYGKGHDDMAEFVLSQKMADQPGRIWSYSSGDTNILMSILKTVYGHEIHFPWTRLFDKLEIQSAVFETDPSGTYVGSSYIYMTPRDLLKIGQLYLNNGKWNGQQLFSKDWISWSMKVPQSMKIKVRNLEDPEPSGAHWWLNQAVPELNISKPWPAAPDDTFLGKGFLGQRIFIIPSEQIVIIRTGDDWKDKLDKNELLAASLKVTRSFNTETEQLTTRSKRERRKRDRISRRDRKKDKKDELEDEDKKNRVFEPGVLNYLTGNTAKEICSCYFVIGQTFDYCDHSYKQNPDVVSVKIDEKKKTVRARISLLSTRRAKWLGPLKGCQLIK